MKKIERNGQQIIINPDFFKSKIPKQGLFKNIEAIMQAIAVSAVKQICKTILESFVSMYENHFDIIRNTKMRKAQMKNLKLLQMDQIWPIVIQLLRRLWTIIGPVEVGSGIFSRPQFWRHPLK